MRKIFLIAVALISATALSGCAPNSVPVASESISTPTSTPTPCVNDPALVGAVDTFLAAARGEGVSVYGEPGGRSNNLIDLLARSDLAALSNPHGSGVIVTLVHQGDNALARSTASRTGWLVLDGVVYPIDVDAAQAFSLLWDGYPEDVKQTAGLGQSYFGLDDYGLTDFNAWNADTTFLLREFLSEANDLCTVPTMWG